MATEITFKDPHKGQTVTLKMVQQKRLDVTEQGRVLQNALRVAGVITGSGIKSAV